MPPLIEGPNSDDEPLAAANERLSDHSIRPVGCRRAYVCRDVKAC
jgi:hypothetical protein